MDMSTSTKLRPWVKWLITAEAVIVILGTIYDFAQGSWSGFHAG